jgi:formate hydrogenlyase subunit 6/NADH:ubiquinone oxidoreductase subunit I
LGDGCTTCEACARVCPTGALQLRESPVRWELAFRFSRCTACGVCVEVCQPGVLRFTDSMDPAGSEAVTLHSLPKRRCARCDRFFVTAGSAELCPVCESDDADFLSIFG